MLTWRSLDPSTSASAAVSVAAFILLSFQPYGYGGGPALFFGGGGACPHPDCRESILFVFDLMHKIVCVDERGRGRLRKFSTPLQSIS